MNDAREKKMLFRFRQNNSGGSWDKNNMVDMIVYIEAYDVQDANAYAEKIGIYFDGCAIGVDCHCCGDRWARQYDPMDLWSFQDAINDAISNVGGVKIWYRRWVITVNKHGSLIKDDIIDVVKDYVINK